MSGTPHAARLPAGTRIERLGVGNAAAVLGVELDVVCEEAALELELRLRVEDPELGDRELLEVLDVLLDDEPEGLELLDDELDGAALDDTELDGDCTAAACALVA